MAELENRYSKGGFKKARFTGTDSPSSDSFIAERTIEIHQVQIKLSAAADAASLLTATINEFGDSSGSSVYDTEILSQDMNALQSKIIVFATPIKMLRNDALDVVYANDSTARTYGITIVYKEIS